MYKRQVLAAASMAGLPPLFGFVAKEAVLQSLTDHGAAHGGPLAWAPLVLMAAGSVLTVAYTWRFLWGSFAAKRDEEGAAVPVTRFHTRVTILELAPAALLALAGLVLAFLPGPVEGIITAHTGSLPPLDPAEKPAYLALWHGWTPILALSAGIWVLGALLALGRPGVEAFQRRVEFPVDALRTYRKITGALDEAAVWVTAVSYTHLTLPTNREV